MWSFFVGAVLYLLYFIPIRVQSDRKAMLYVIGFTEGEKTIRLNSGLTVWILEPGDVLNPHMKYVVFRGNFSGADPRRFSEDADRYGTWIGLLEFNESLPFVKEVNNQRLFKERIFRVHTIRQEEVVKMRLDERMIYHRLRRAILERSVDMLWLQPLENIDVASLIQKIEREFGKPVNEPQPQQIGNTLPWIPLSLIVLLISSFSFLIAAVTFILFFFSFDLSVFVASIVGTVTAYLTVRKRKYLPFVYLLLGLLTYASLTKFGYMNDLLQFRGVKLSLVALPFVVTVKVVLQNRDFIKQYKKYLPYFGAVFLAFGYYYITRSGNFAIVPDFERKIRDIVESILWVRPRLKEIIGYPAYFVYLSYSKKRWLSFFEVLGAIALVSTFNTFCHIKTPLIVSLYRSAISIILGYLTLYIVGRIKGAKRV